MTYIKKKITKSENFKLSIAKIVKKQNKTKQKQQYLQ